MKLPYISINADGRATRHSLPQDDDSMMAIKKSLLEYSITNDVNRLPNGLFVLISLPAKIKTLIGKNL